jgi:hypothetical protein
MEGERDGIRKQDERKRAGVMLDTRGVFRHIL